MVSNFIIQALSGRPITIYGDGSQTRSFCFVSDLIDGLIRLMNSPAEVTGPINLGNPVELTIRQLAELVVAKVGGEASMEFRPLPQDDPTQRQPNIAKARETLGWNPKVALEEGLDATIAYFKRLSETPLSRVGGAAKRV